MSLRVDDLFSVTGKVVLVTGGGTGIGKAIADGFATNGAKVYITGRRADVLEAAARGLSTKTKAQVIAIQGDVSNKAGCQAIAADLSSKENKLDTLVNCAGVSKGWAERAEDQNDGDQVIKMLNSVEDEDFSYSNNVNLNGVYFMTVALLPLLRNSSDPNVTVISSIAGLMNGRTMSNLTYSVSKAAANHCAHHLAVRLHPLKIRVNTICPGYFPTAMNGVHVGTDHPDAAEGSDIKLDDDIVQATKRLTAGRAGRRSEIVGPVLMLSSQAGGYMNGAVLTVDGGKMMAGDINEGVKLPNELCSA